MAKAEWTTILERVAEHPGLLTQILAGVKSRHESYLANLILKSPEIVARRSAQWDYKSLLHYGEEDFAKGGGFYISGMVHGIGKAHWSREAALQLASEVTRSVIYEDGEGLVLFVQDGSNYRAARRGDAPYDFVKRLLADGNLSDIAIDNPPSWAQELFLNQKNLDAYACLWYDLDYLSKPGREDLKRVRREAVWRETLRLSGHAPFADTEVPEPAQWPVLGSIASPLVSSVAGDAGAGVPLATRERNTLLCIIAVLCKEAKFDFTKTSKTAALIESTAAGMGVLIGETTIEGHLKRIPDAMATRMK